MQQPNNLTTDGAGGLDAVVTIPAGSPTNAETLLEAQGLGAGGEPRLLVERIGLSPSLASDEDGDGLGDACDPCPLDFENDVDGDGQCANGSCESGNNCPFDANPNELNSDRDGAGDVCDGAPSDPGVFAAPGEVLGLSFETDQGALTWTSATGSSGALTVHDVTRGALDSLPVGTAGICLVAGLSEDTTTDTEVPTLGQSFWYLVRARNSLGTGTYGYRSDGSERIASACP